MHEALEKIKAKFRTIIIINLFLAILNTLIKILLVFFFSKLQKCIQFFFNHSINTVSINTVKTMRYLIYKIEI